MYEQRGGWVQGVYALLLSVEQQITKEKVKFWRENAQILIEKAWEVIENWDIRKAGKLIEAFPTIVDKSCRGRMPICDIDEKGNWCVCFK